MASRLSHRVESSGQRHPATEKAQSPQVPQVFVLAGGMGTRLREAIPGIPKVLAPIDQQPFLSYVLQRLYGQGIRDVTLCTGYLHDLLYRFYGQGETVGLRISYSREFTPLGTGGALCQARAEIRTDPLLVVNGDSYIEFSLNELMAYHRGTHADVTIVASPSDDVAASGNLTLAQTGRVTAFREKPRGHARGLINAGVYVMSRHFLDFLCSHFSQEPISLEREGLPAFMQAGGLVYGLPSNGYFIDIGTPERYERARKQLPKELTK